MKRLAVVAATSIATALLALGAAAALVASGAYEVAADAPQSQVLHGLLDWMTRRSVQRRAAGIQEPALDSPLLVERGVVCFVQHCAGCHGPAAQSADEEAVAAVLLPRNGSLADAARKWRPREMVWIVRHGIRTGGMPALGKQLHDDDLWALAAYLHAMPSLSPQQHAQLQERLQGGRCEAPGTPEGVAPLLVGHRSASPPAGDGRQLLQRNACHACHRVPRAVAPRSDVGTPMVGLAQTERLASLSGAR